MPAEDMPRNCFQRLHPSSSVSQAPENLIIAFIEGFPDSEIRMFLEAPQLTADYEGVIKSNLMRSFILRRSAHW